MKQQMLLERVELLAIGEALGYPRIGIGHANGRKHSIRAGQSEWERFCAHAHATRIPTALRIGRILRLNEVTPYNPRITLTEAPEGWVAHSDEDRATAMGSTAAEAAENIVDLLDAFPMPDNEPVAVKARRGRPKGSKNRVKVSA